MEKTKGAGFDQAAQPQGKKILFGIGINAYQSKFWPKLNNAVRDVEAIASTLRNRYDFDKVRLLRDEEATAANIQQALYDFTNPSEIGENDSLLVYYSGHGHLDKNDLGYWVPVDAEKGKIYTYLPNSRIRELIANIKCKHILFISDACFSGSIFFKGMRGSGAEEVAEEYEKRVSRWAFCSGRHDEMVSDGKPGGHSPFAGAILEELNLNERKKLNFVRLADKVIEITRFNYKQMPEANPIQDAGHKGGQFVFTLRDPDWKIKLPVRVLKPKPPFPIKLWAGILLVMFIAAGIAIATWMHSSPKNEGACLSLLPNSFISLDTVEMGKLQHIQFRLKNCGKAEARLASFTFFPNTDITMDDNQGSIILAGKEQSFSAAWKPVSLGRQICWIKIKGENLREDILLQVEAFVKEKTLVQIDTPKIPETIKNFNDKSFGKTKNQSGFTPAKSGKVENPIHESEKKGTSSDKTFPMETNVSMDIDMFLEFERGPNIYPTVEGGKRIFKIPKGQKGYVSVYFKPKNKPNWDMECWDTVPIENLRNITPPKCAY